MCVCVCMYVSVSVYTHVSIWAIWTESVQIVKSQSLYAESIFDTNTAMEHYLNHQLYTQVHICKVVLKLK